MRDIQEILAEPETQEAPASGKADVNQAEEAIELYRSGPSALNNLILSISTHANLRILCSWQLAHKLVAEEDRPAVFGVRSSLPLLNGSTLAIDESHRYDA